VLCVIAVAVALLVRAGDRRGAGELALLSVLGVVASPLVAFAVYFASWHALRHTARLAADPVGVVRPAALARTFAAGLPALVVTIVVAAVCVLGFREHAVLSTWMWVGLALVWGLTVPHMVVVARFDRDRQARSTFSIGRPLASSSTSLSR
jgi:Brp/Blh family beta-carotene 15,15'-monooxygenase